MSETLDLNSPEVKAAIKAAVDEATGGLIAKRDELLGEVKKLRKGQEIKPEEYQSLKEENDELQEKLTASQKQIKDSTKALEALQLQFKEESGFTQKLLIDNGLTDALLKAGVKPELTKAAKALFASQATIKIDGAERSAIIGDKSITDFVAEWSKSDEGKHFVAAPNNTGGNAQGGRDGGTGKKTMARTEFDALDAAGRMNFAKEGGKITE